MFVDTKTLAVKELVPGINARLIHTEGLTIAHVTLDKGAVLPEHAHPHEQVTNVISGAIELTVNGETKVCHAGDVVVIPGNVPHSAVAPETCIVIDVFRPVREDYR